MDTAKRTHDKGMGAGEHLLALDWAHPQFGNLLAVGTSHGRVLLVTNRPAISDELHIQRPKWHLCCVLLGLDKIHTRCKVTCVHRPCLASVVLGCVAHRMALCAAEPLLLHPVMRDCCW